MDERADERYEAGPKDYTVAWLLQTFLGFFGASRFYMGKWVTGILWLLTGGMFAIGWTGSHLFSERRFPSAALLCRLRAASTRPYLRTLLRAEMSVPGSGRKGTGSATHERDSYSSRRWSA